MLNWIKKLCIKPDVKKKALEWREMDADKFWLDTNPGDKFILAVEVFSPDKGFLIECANVYISEDPVFKNEMIISFENEYEWSGWVLEDFDYYTKL